MTSAVEPLVLISIDGWGTAKPSEIDGNAIANAHIPCMGQLSAKPAADSTSSLHALIDASGLSVGLPEGVMGNSEVGHLTMGAGRVSYQDLVRINQCIAKDQLKDNEVLKQALRTAADANSRLHLLGLISDGGVHSHIEHVFRLLELAAKSSVKECYIHFFADGRDTKPQSCLKFMRDVEQKCASLQYGSLATVVGRYYAMDRDKRWERIAVAYDMLTAGKGQACNGATLESIVQERFNNKETDEFLKPIIVNEKGLLQENDTLIFFDYRSDRMREIVSLFAEAADELPFAAQKELNRTTLHPYIMTQYDEKWSVPILFPPQSFVNGLSEWLSKSGVHQFHTAETEKYAHVTFFFGGGREEAFENEARAMIPSPKVATYDLAPEMSQAAVADSVIDAIKGGKYQFILCNFAAPDMVGHTGVYEATLKAVECCDAQIARIVEACRAHNYHLVVTADHGNAESMLDFPERKPKTSHTTNLIPFIVLPRRSDSNHSPAAAAHHAVSAKPTSVRFTDAVIQQYQRDPLLAVGGLSDVAPSVLTLMGLPVPPEMTGSTLVVKP